MRSSCLPLARLTITGLPEESTGRNACHSLGSVLPHPLPLRLAVQVDYQDKSLGPESLRAEVERQIVREIGDDGCYTQVERLGFGSESGGDEESRADLLLRIGLSQLEVAEDWDLSLADRTSPNRGGENRDAMRVARVAYNVEMELLVLPGRVPLRQRHYHHSESYRPLGSEDPREAVRTQAVHDLARSARRLVCKGRNKLPREIERSGAQQAD